MTDTPRQPGWSNQTALITGAAGGLGFALARKLAGAGIASVGLLDCDGDKLDAAAMKLGDRALPLTADVTNPDSVRQAVARFLEKADRITILVNCAGITGRTNIRSHEVDLDDFDRVMEVNLRGSLITSQAVLPGMLEQDYGRILHVASISGKEGNAGMLAYSTSKAAVIGMTKVQGKDYAETGITINAIAPAVIRTTMVENMPEEQVKYMTDKIPMKRCGTLEEFADAAAFIVSPQNSFVTGFVYDLSGGRATY